MKPTLLLDGDQFVYKATVACETEVRWDEDNHVLGCNAEEAFDVAMGQISRVMKALGSNIVWLAFTQGHNFRKDVSETYKGNRQNTRKPLAYFEVKDRLSKEFKAYGVDGLEADDVMGIWQTKDPEKPTIIVSDDKDMKTIPGKLYRRNKGEYELVDISETEADYNFLHQVLTGDATDGYGGCPGVGPAGATKILGSAPGTMETFDVSKTYWPEIVKTYEAKGLSEEDALIQARMARILRFSDWNGADRKPILWSPN